ncbi:MAG: NAD-dependent epimerase/dehydratase family protein [Candidatus Omnitrophota bacterium]|nr:NAD-dependent epimerase/dehydratase family protein [Candidatus Omnitrophota bacterium]
MRYKALLITGGAGFIGSNLAVAFKQKYPKLKVYALDNLKRRGSEQNIIRLKENGINFIHADIRNPEDLVLDFNFDLMIECSAEPSVMAGIDNPLYIINTNLTGTVNCLELCRRQKADIIFLSTSRVYPYKAINKIKAIETSTRFEWDCEQDIFGWSPDGINENFTISGPKTLYGATKFSSELLLQEYIANYGIKGVINRCGVIAGPWQFGKVDQGVFTYWMLAHYYKKPLKYIGFGGKGKQVRDLLHVDDLFNLIDLEVAKLSKINGRNYNVGGGKQVNLSLRETTELCQQINGNKIKIGTDLNTRPGDISIYLTDNSKVTKDLGWKPKKNAQSILTDIYSWVRKNRRGFCFH